ncbi:ZBED1 [Branchiostoma lanceolatum]|uniref:ZBED1 protein n=1 Tax=Branchiostoma lanceolatum TaxID=7740 RepID=A0A8J9YVM3_BRALA|nr:ZBED1 [Branchiostoma lanceolatum]
MVDRFVEQYPAVVAACLDDRVKKKDSFKKLQKCSDDDIDRMERFLEVMRLPFKITVAMSAEKRPTSGQVLPMLQKLQQHTADKEEDDKFTKDVKSAIRKDLSGRYREVDRREFLEEATALDPRFKSCPSGRTEPEEVVPLQKPQEDSQTPAKKQKLNVMEEIFEDGDDDDVVVTHIEPPIGQSQEENVRDARANGTAEEQRKRLSKDKDRAAKTRAKETALQRSKRLSKDKEKTTESRRNETALQRSKRLSKDKEKTTESRKNETALQRRTRLSKVKEKTTESRKNETALRRSIRLSKDKEKTTESRRNETALQRRTRLSKVKAKTTESRKNETALRRSTRMSKDKERIAEGRAVQTHTVLQRRPSGLEMV